MYRSTPEVRLAGKLATEEWPARSREWVSRIFYRIGSGLTLSISRDLSRYLTG